MSEMRLVFELSPYGLLTFGVITQIKFARLLGQRRGVNNLV